MLQVTVIKKIGMNFLPLSQLVRTAIGESCDSAELGL